MGGRDRRPRRGLAPPLRAAQPLEARRRARAASRVHRLPRRRAGPAVNVCFVNEYFPPFAPGGAEWSLDALAHALAGRGHRVTIVTPNWGAAPREEHDGVRIVRFAFPKRLEPGRQPAPAKWLANPFFYGWAALAVFRAARRARADVIHAQNKHSLIPATLAGRLLGIPVFLTIRDGSIIDAAPVCLHHHDGMPADCGVRKLWGECSEEYFRLYVRNPRQKLRSKLAFLYLWLDSRLKQRFLRHVDCVIGVSQGILDIYRRSGLLDRVRPVVATRVGGTPELVIDGKTGVLVDRGAPGELASAIVTLLRDEELRTTLGAGARRHIAERLSAEDSVERLLAVYQGAGR